MPLLLVENASADPVASVGATQPTIGSTWLSAGQRPADDDLLAWPPDIFAFTDVILERSEAYRFVVSPPPGQTWPPAGDPAWRDAVTDAAQRWSLWAEEPSGDPPGLVVQEWRVVHEALDTPLNGIASGTAWRVCQALLTLHAVSDEACAGIVVPGPVSRHRVVLGARMSDLLARAGTVARVDPSLLRVVPKYRTSPGGIKPGSISRHLSRTGPAVTLSVDRVTTAPGDAAPERLNVVILPWPLRIAAEDFRAVPDSVQEREVEPFGFFQFHPSEPLDTSLVGRLLTSARNHADRVDLVVLPESAVADRDLPRLEAALSRNGVTMLVAGVRSGPPDGTSLGSNWVHFGVELGGRWWHYRQDKHHRWSLDPSQIEQYHLERVLDPRVRWWEAIEITRRSLHIVDRQNGDTIAALVCEDLAQIDQVGELLRSVGPTLVLALLLDGPQLGSRWAARYASVLADDPGSAVLTLTSYGMVANAWRAGEPPSSVVALWKDSARGSREIELDRGAQGVLLQLDRHRAIRRAADGRLPEQTASELRLSRVTQLRPTPIARVVERSNGHVRRAGLPAEPANRGWGSVNGKRPLSASVHPSDRQ